MSMTAVNVVTGMGAGYRPSRSATDPAQAEAWAAYVESPGAMASLSRDMADLERGLPRPGAPGLPEHALERVPDSAPVDDSPTLPARPAVRQPQPVIPVPRPAPAVPAAPPLSPATVPIPSRSAPAPRRSFADVPLRPSAPVRPAPAPVRPAMPSPGRGADRSGPSR